MLIIETERYKLMFVLFKPSLSDLCYVLPKIVQVSKYLADKCNRFITQCRERKHLPYNSMITLLVERK